MAYALVGSLGTPVQTASGSAVSGLAYGQTPTAGNRLIIWWSGQGAATTPSTPSGWTAASGKSGESLLQSKLFTKIAAGSDSVPAFGAVTSQVQTVMLGEFSGTNSTAALDQLFTDALSLTSPQTTAPASSDATAGELICYVASILHSSAQTDTAAGALNNGATAHDTTNNGTSTVNHYLFGWGITTSNAVADSLVVSFTATNMSAFSSEGASFKVLVPPFVPALFSVSDPLGTRIPGID